LTPDGRMLHHGISSHGLLPGELKMKNFYLKVCLH